MREHWQDSFGLSLEVSRLGGCTNKNSYFRVISMSDCLVGFLVQRKRIFFVIFPCECGSVWVDLDSISTIITMLSYRADVKLLGSTLSTERRLDSCTISEFSRVLV